MSSMADFLNWFWGLREANVARAEEWHSGVDISLSFRGNELAGETGEACNLIKKLDRERLGLIGSRATVAQLAEELADVIICVDLIAMELDLDMDVEVARKFNKTSIARGLKTRMLVPQRGSNEKGSHEHQS